jgi:hypothetical protein
MSATDRMHWVVFAAALAAFLVWPFGGFDSIHGDNICQVAYWRVLLHPHLVGAIGASSPKLGITLVLGLTYDLSDLLFHSSVLIRAVLAIFAAFLVSSTARIAGDLAGPTAAALAAAYLVWGTPMSEMFVGGTSMVFFLPLFLAGVRQFAQGRPTAGAGLLGCSSLFRIESIFVLAWLTVSEGLFGRRWRLFWTCVAIMGAVCLAVIWFNFALQGDLSRFNAGGPQTGYVVAAESSFRRRLARALAFVYASPRTVIFEECRWPYLALPGLGMLLLARQRRVYLAGVMGIPLFLVTYVVVSGDSASRWFEFLIPFVAAFGVAGVVATVRIIGRDALSARVFRVTSRATMCAAALLLAGVLVTMVRTAGPGWGRAPFTLDAIRFLNARQIPKGAAVLIDDDITYGIVIREPDFFRRVTALPYFNIKDDDWRRKVLDDTDYIVVSKREYPLYYLLYDPVGRGDSDPFRRAISQMAAGAPAQRVYDRELVPIVNNKRWLIVKVGRIERS